MLVKTLLEILNELEAEGRGNNRIYLYEKNNTLFLVPDAGLFDFTDGDSNYLEKLKKSVLKHIVCEYPGKSFCNFHLRKDSK